MSKPWLALVVVSLGMFVVELDTTVVSVALPSIQHTLHFAAGELQWVIDAYLLCFGGFLLLAGRLADRFGNGRMFVVGMAAFAIGSAASALAPTPGLLIAGRALQGLGGATLMPTTLSTITRSFPEGAERRAALGLWTAIQTGSVALGLVVGGLVTAALSWRWIFTINLPVAALALLGAFLFVAAQPAGTDSRPFDALGSAAITAGLALATLGLAKTGATGWQSPATLGPLALAIALIAAFLVIERQSPAPMVPPALVRIRTVAVGNVAFMVASAGMYGLFFFCSLYAQGAGGLGPLRAGIALLPLPIGVLVGVSAAQRLLRRLPLPCVAAGGLMLSAAGSLGLLRLSVGGAYASGLLPGLTTAALGLGLAMVPVTALAMSGVPARDAGTASGLYNAASYTGGAAGLAVLSTVAADRSAHLGGAVAGALAGYHAAFAVAGGLLVAAATLVLAGTRPRGEGVGA